MTKEECSRIWDEIFVLHRALMRLQIEDHRYLDKDNIYERTCRCITTILKYNGYDLGHTMVYGGILPSTLNSDWQNRLLNFEKDNA